jgi:hypothetical protein
MKMKRNIGGRHQTVQFMIASGALTMGLFAKHGWLKALGFALGGTALTTAITRRWVLGDALGKGMHALRRVA